MYPDQQYKKNLLLTDVIYIELESEQKQTQNEYKYDDENELDVVLFDGLIKLGLDARISNESVYMLRYFQYIHISIKHDASIGQIVINLKFQSLNGSM